MQARHPTDMVNGNSHKMNTSDFCMCGGCWSTYIHKRPNIGNALRSLFTGTQSEKDGSNKARVLSHMSLGVISTKQHPPAAQRKFFSHYTTRDQWRKMDFCYIIMFVQPANFKL